MHHCQALRPRPSLPRCPLPASVPHPLPFSGPPARPPPLCLPATAHLLFPTVNREGLGLPAPEHLPLLGLLWDEEQQHAPGRLWAGAPVRKHTCRSLPGDRVGAWPLLCVCTLLLCPIPCILSGHLLFCYEESSSLLSCSPPLTSACALLQTWCQTSALKPACPWSPSLHWNMVGHALLLPAACRFPVFTALPAAAAVGAAFSAVPWCSWLE